MRFMAIVKATTDSEAGRMPRQEDMAAMGAFADEMVKAGVLLRGEGLHPSSIGARVRYSGTSRTVTDGPFTETKELIGGFWILECASLAEAVDWMKRSPNPGPGDTEIEIRRIFDMDDFGAELTPEIREGVERRRDTVADRKGGW